LSFIPSGQKEVTMPFKSKRQARFMFSQHPRIAKRWVKESGSKHPIKGLPEKKSRRKSK